MEAAARTSTAAAAGPTGAATAGRSPRPRPIRPGPTASTSTRSSGRSRRASRSATASTSRPARFRSWRRGGSRPSSIRAAIKPSLLEQLRKSAGAPANIAPVEPPAGYEFEDHTIFDTHNGLLRGIRKLLNPLLKLFFNPNPIAHALNTQAKLNKDAAKREQERERTQAEWNALHYTLVERLVTELSRTSIEAQSLA